MSHVLPVRINSQLENTVSSWVSVDSVRLPDGGIKHLT